MNLSEIKKKLEEMFSTHPKTGSDRNIIFWYDDNGEFLEGIESLILENAKIIILKDNNAFRVKKSIEVDNTTDNLLIYAPMPKPAWNENWLADTLKYSQSFSTDVTSLNLLNLGLGSEPELREVIEKYKDFFKNSQRNAHFERYNLQPYTEEKIDLGVLSVLCKLKAPSMDDALLAILIEKSRGESEIMENISKFGSLETFWEMIQKNYGYNEKENLDKLTITLLTTHFAHNFAAEEKFPEQWKKFVSKNTNCFIFVDKFMKDKDLQMDYNEIADFVASSLNLENQLKEWSIEEIIECDTFDLFDKQIIKRINENILSGADEFEKYLKIIEQRRNRQHYKIFEKEYDLLRSICRYFELNKKHPQFSGINTTQLFNNYAETYYQFEQYYRHFINTYDKLGNPDDFEPLFEKIENNYTNHFLKELSIKWCNLLDEEPTWKVPDIPSQQKFYLKHVDPHVRHNDKIIVIVSDALRYESAQELAEQLNDQNRTVELESMFGVIPSYTALGMAALLPYSKITMEPKTDSKNVDVLINDISTQGTENRDKILKLKKEEAIAVSYENEKLSQITTTKLKELLSGKKLIYIYHNIIDARGDHATTEKEVFDATEKCFKELIQLVEKLKRAINANNILITADHGYIYRRTPLEESDKTPKEIESSIRSSRRYILTYENAEIESTQTFDMNYLLSNEESIKAIIPRSTNCFKIQGAGTNFVHGGSSLQEIVIPVIKIKSSKNNKDEDTKKVSIDISTPIRKITNMITYLEFFQPEKVDEKTLPRRFKLYFEDENGTRISNENIIIADKRENTPEERIFKEKFTMKNIPYDKSNIYYLIIEDEEELVEKIHKKIKFEINLVFRDIF